mmetsp:Transcript_24226/g.30872  ORF Transcript_24226/g.30872 Transcript_24226/m.30872 type:complete len:83 (+) Transcript_24226:322-570(+)
MALHVGLMHHRVALALEADHKYLHLMEVAEQVERPEKVAVVVVESETETKQFNIHTCPVIFAFFLQVLDKMMYFHTLQKIKL